MIRALTLVTLALAGCASTGVIQTDPGVYTVARKNPQVGSGPPMGVRADVYDDANEFCAKQGKVVKTVKLDLTNAGFARSAAASLQFTCEPK